MTYETSGRGKHREHYPIFDV